MRVVIRDSRGGDVAYVMDTWMRAWASGRPRMWRGVDADRFMRGHRQFVEDLFARSRIRVAVDPEVDDVIFGWLAHEGPVLHFVYTKKPFRRHGIATALLKEAGRLTHCSHPTHDGRKYLLRPNQIQESPGHAFYPPLESHDEEEQRHHR